LYTCFRLHGDIDIGVLLSKPIVYAFAFVVGLGKTIMTIAFLAYLACEKGNWGQHLIVVPTSVLVNWEMEFKRWLPGFKILTYFGSVKQRNRKRRGWDDPNSFHVCITSYSMILSDAAMFKRRKWHYLILDEAQNIRNFRSQRWQTLLTFNTQRRLLLTGTPLNNNVMGKTIVRLKEVDFFSHCLFP